MTVGAAQTAADLEKTAREFVPLIRERARQMEMARRLDTEMVEAMEAAGLFSVVVPERWGGAGLGPHEVNTVVEIVANGDVSTAWVTGFYNLHNWFLCKFPLEVQEQLYDGRCSVRAAAVFSPPGVAERVEGGIRLSGRWGYATGVLHASHALLPAMVDGVFTWCIARVEDLEVLDDWDVAAMAATGSVTVVADGVFIPATWSLAADRLMSPTDHPGIFHQEEAYRLSFSALTFTTASLYVGALDAGVELAREKLSRASGPGGVARIERSPMRINWVNAYQTARVLRLVRDRATEEAIQIARRGAPQTLEEEARTQLDIMTMRHSAKDALRTLVDASGSSAYRNSDHLRRMANDIAMISTHALNGEHDVAMDRHARWLLGMGLAPGDPGYRLT